MEKPLSKAKLARVKQCLQRTANECATILVEERASILGGLDTSHMRLEAIIRDVQRTQRLLKETT